MLVQQLKKLGDQELLSKTLEYAKNIENNYDWNYFFEWAKGKLHMSDEKWQIPPVSAETFINSSNYLNIAERTFPKVKEIALNMIEGKYLEGVIIAGIGCLSGDTHIKTKDGVMKLRDIPNGMHVLSYNADSGKVEYKPSSGAISKGIQDTYLVIFEGYGHIQATSSHPIYTEDGWKPLCDLKVGDYIYKHDSFVPYEEKNSLKQDKNGQLTKVKIKSIEKFSKQETFDLEVQDNFNFFANGVLVHNSGKSYVSQIIGAYQAHKLLCMKDPHDYYGLAKDKNIVIVNMGTSAQQAKNVVFTGMSNLIKDSKFFKKFNPDLLRTEIRFEERRILIISGNSRETGPLGMNVHSAILDEAAFYRDYDGKDVAQSIYDTLERRIRSRFKLDGILMMISSPNYEQDFIISKAKEAILKDQKGRILNDRLYTHLSPTWRFQQSYMADEYQNSDKHFFFDQMTNRIVDRSEIDEKDTAWIRADDMLRDKKYWQIPNTFENTFRTNPEKAKRDFAAVPSLTVEGFFQNSRVIDEMSNPAHQNPLREDGTYEFPMPYRTPHYIHLDLALNKDGRGDFAGFCFPAGVKVTMADGTKKSIEKIKLHDEVISHTGKKRLVTELHFRPYTGVLYQIVDNEGNKVESTDEHPFAIIKENGSIDWKPANKIKRKDTLLIYSNGKFVHTKVKDIHCRDVVKTPVFNIGVKNDNSYVAGDIVVHNCMVHLDGWEKNEDTFEYYPKVYVDLIEQIGADPIKGEIDFEGIRQKIYDLQDSGFMIKTVSVDGFQCVTGDTLIMMANYKKKKIQDIKIGDYVQSVNVDGEMISNEVKRIWSKENQEITRVYFENGKYIDCTKQHAFLMRDGTYSKVEDMAIGDELKTIFASVYWRVTCIDTLKDKQTVWDMEVDAPHNFVTGVGVIAHNSVDMQQILRSKGIDTKYISVDRTLEPYMNLKEIINMKRIDIYKHEQLETELKQLELVRGKKVDHPKGGGKDCLAGDTTIKMLNGEDVPIRELVGKQIGVYACDENATMHVAPAYNIHKVGDLPVMKLGFDNGEYLECTPDHEIMLRDGTFKEAKDLDVGQALMGYVGMTRRVVEIEDTGKITDVYDMTVDKHHNFALSSGIFVHNCADALAGACQSLLEDVIGDGAGMSV